jgi:hypothetical protein
MGRKKPTLLIFLKSISITPRDISDFPLRASVAVIKRLSAIILSLIKTLEYWSDGILEYWFA